MNNDLGMLDPLQQVVAVLQEDIVLGRLAPGAVKPREATR